MLDVLFFIFFIDVDVVFYSNMCCFINKGKLFLVDVICMEELVNYFFYDYLKLMGSDFVKIMMEVGICFWNVDYCFVCIGLKVKEILMDNLFVFNFVFLIDVFGFMWGVNWLDLVKFFFKLLVNNLCDKDKVVIVIYVGNVGVKLEVILGSDK